MADPLARPIAENQAETLEGANAAAKAAKKDERPRPVEDDDDTDTPTVPFPIAIVGMAMRLPGGVSCETQFWEFLLNKRDGLCKVPDSRYNIDAFHDDSRRGGIRTTMGYFLEHDIAQFDAGFFGFSRREAAKLDPQQRQMLELVWECMENGGQTEWKGTNIGCYVGSFGEDWLELKLKDPQDHDSYRVIGASDFALSNLISYKYDLGGPSMTVRTGCSASLVGLHEACQAIYSGECSSALVAGTNLILAPSMSISMSDNMVISPSGICRTFDAAADGYGRGEAVNVIFIKPLDQALRDGDPVRAVIRSSAVNCDGQTPSFTTPGAAAQERLIRRAYRKAGIEVSQTALFECHGTGTAVGDSVETTALANIFAENGIYIGAVKPNVGHSEGASGITSVLKSVLALENSTIPPNVHFQTPNPNIPFQQANLRVAVEAAAWPADRSRRISVNSFGIGGTNAHVILDSSPETQRSEQCPDVDAPPGLHCLFLSARSKESLDGQVENLQKYLRTTKYSLVDIAYTLGLRRDHMAHRAFALADGDAEKALVFQKSESFKGRIVFTFTGQGAQWSGMARELIVKDDGVRSDIREMDRVLQRVVGNLQWSMEDELSRCDNTSRVAKAELVHPLSTAVQIAVVNLLKRWGISPDAVVGHSSGEIAAAYASGALAADVAILVAYFRGQAMKTLSPERRGGMAAVGLSSEKAQSFLQPGVVIACDNGPQSVTLSGDEDSLAEVVEKIRLHDPDTFCRSLNVDFAYHSHHMADAGKAYEKLLSPHFSHQRSMIPMYSSLSGTIISDPSILSAGYWRRNLESPVRFNTAIQRILQDDEQAKLFLEIGPHSALSGPIRQSLAKAGTNAHRYIPTIIRGKDPWMSLHMTAGNLYTCGQPIYLPCLIPQGKVVTELPTYSWQHDERFWEEARLVHDWRYRQHPHHELLGSRSLESSDVEPSWRNMLNLETAFWLLDHKLAGEIVFPAACYVAMAGEAVRQVSGSPDYSIRNMFIRNALVLKDVESVEIITNLRPVKLADNLDSVWFDFSILSYQNGKWKKHCVGQVRGGTDQNHEFPPNGMESRQVEADKWYRALSKHGLDFGPHFQVLEQISASPSTLQASAMLQGINPPQSSYYALHPTVIDGCLQLLSVAATQGISSHITRLSIPTAFPALYVSEGRGPMEINSSCEVTGTTTQGSSSLFSNDKLVLRLEKGVFFRIQNLQSEESNLPLVSNISSTQHIDFVPMDEHLPPFDDTPFEGQLWARLTSVYLVEAYRRSKNSIPSADHLQKYHSWLQSQYHKIRDKAPEVVPEMKEADTSVLGLCGPYMDTLRAEMGKKHRMIMESHRLSEQICHAIHDILEGRKSALEILVQNDGLKRTYDFMALGSRCETFVRLLGQSNPILRILEIGAGTGGLTSTVLQSLSASRRQRIYAKYTFTDVSGGFLAGAQERFHEYDAIEYATLDIARDPEEQGFAAESYDLIIAGCVIHATPRISETLRNIRKLVAPGGRLLVQELNGSVPWVNLIMGGLPGWWLGGDDDRIESPALSIERWHEELINADFTGIDAVQYPDEKPLALTMTFLSRPTPSSSSPQGVHVGLMCLSLAAIPELGRALGAALSAAGYVVTWYALQDPPPPGSDAISLIDLDGPFFHHLSDEQFTLFQRYVAGMADAHLLWITRSCQTHCEDPRYALVLGVARGIRAELGHKFATLEIDGFDSTIVTSALKVFKKLRDQVNFPWLVPDYEFALKGGDTLVTRLHWSSFDRQLAELPQPCATRALDIGSEGILDSLRWAMSEPSPQDLKEDEIELDIKYIGLNFRDMMIAMGFLGDISEVGLECSGVVRRIGSGVGHLKAGDRVAAIYPGLLRTQRVIPATACHLIPDRMSLEEAATVPCVFSTALYCLMTVGNLKKGQTVLIHSACGGVGLAAIQVCRMIGAEIYATVGTPDKVRYLTDVVKIPADHIFDSRSTSFLAGVQRSTHGRGMDLVLNSLSGELLHASWKCVAEFGKMVEIGKRDFLGHGKLDMDLFLGNRTFIGVDLTAFGAHDPTGLHALLEQFNDLFARGHLTPIRPVTLFDAGDIVKAFRHMQTGHHIGKIAVRMPEDPNSLPISRIHDTTPIFRPDAAYLLIGGLGGLGRAISTWMVKRGARNLIYLSPSAGKSDIAQAFIKDLEMHAGVTVASIAGDVTSSDDVQRALSAAKGPVAGVFQMSMCIKDRLLSEMTYDEWSAALAPKVQGTWSLHFELRDIALDFFVLFSSLSGIVGFAGQANYGAANTFLDSFVKYRHSQGLPASVLDLGFMADIGYMAEKTPRTSKLANSVGGILLNERDLFRALEISVLTPPCQSSQIVVGLGTLDPAGTGNWAHDGRFSGWSNVSINTQEIHAPRSDQLRALVDEIRRNPSLLDEPHIQDLITIELGKVLAAHLGHEEDLSKEELANIVIDSLMSIEVRSWFRRNAGIDISLVEIANAGTVGGLAEIAVKQLRKQNTAGENISNQAATPPATPPEELAICLRDLELGGDLRPISATAIPDWCSASEGKVFVTGVTGFIGAFFLFELLALPQIKSVACLIRTSDPASGRLRIEETFTRYSLPVDRLSKIIVIPGNIAHANLGMSQEAFEHHAYSSSAVFHLATYVNYTLPYSAHRQANVLGLIHVLEFVNTGRLKALHYCSSIGACDASSYVTGTTLQEDDRPVLDPKYFHNSTGYNNSKLVAENIVWNAIANQFPVAIYRPGIVMGHSGTGANKPEDIFSRLVVNSIRLGAFPILPQQRTQIVPVDYVCAAMLHISQFPQHHGHAFNIVQSNQSECLTWTETFAILNECDPPSTPMRALPPDEWLQVFAEQGKRRMKVAAPLLRERLSENACWWDSTSRIATCDTTNLQAALADSPSILAVKPMTELLRTYYPRWKAAAADTHEGTDDVYT
ncbi:hypothetical protein BO71DRAFT_455104 [Aspergillus ellipticus CBS 707.79]|uniref:Uncharacterized protein n=1 Tax=Aspergillus ellipticus CBS 707.79 TaxID=1448320 RepID=A0A319DRC3_9EURO|nr:hypothetical protein BO71DRAFT_455104 [Aspergillus ellipticus CBS 707.79]